MTLSQQGVKFPLKSVPEEERKKDLKLTMNKGNRKSAQMQDKKLQKSISQDVKMGHLLPIPLEIVEEIP